MRSYSCPPKSRAYYRAPFAGFANPYFPQTTNEVNRRNPVAQRPMANILRTENSYKIELAVPGLTRDDIHIEVKDDHVMITGKNATEGEKPKMLRQEFNYAGFRRLFRLHENADKEAISAEFNAGILTISIPDKAKVTTQINIQ